MEQNKLTFKDKLKDDIVFRNKVFLTLSMLWGFLQAIYNFLIGYLDQKSVFSWFYGLTIWFGILGIVKLVLLINSLRIGKGKEYINFKAIAVTYLFINTVQVALITLTPKFVGAVFASKFKAVTIVNLIINFVSCCIFFSSWTHIPKKKFTLEEYGFLKTKQYIGRSEGFFTIILLAFNIVMILIKYNVVVISNEIIANVYMGVGLTFLLGNLIAGIWLSKSDKLYSRK